MFITLIVATTITNWLHSVLEQYSPSALKHQAEVVQTEIKDLTHQLEPLKQERYALLLHQQCIHTML